MKMFKKVLALVLAFGVTIAATVGVTLAYLTEDVGHELNVFTVGNIDVDLNEQVGILGEGGEVKETEDGAEYIEIMPGDYLKKKVTVSNEGKNDAYVAVTVTLKNDNGDFALLMNQAIDEFYGDENAQEVYDFIFDGWGMNHSKDTDGDNVDDAFLRLTITGDDMPEHTMQVDAVKTITDYNIAYAGNWFDNHAKGMGTYELKYVYYLFLEPGESSVLFDGINVPADFNNEQMKMFDGMKIDIDASAIQADNMAIADAYKGKENAEAKSAFYYLAGGVVPEYSNKPTGTENVIAYTTTGRIWGVNGSNAKQSHVIKIYSGDTYMGETSLNNINGIIDGDVYVTWGIDLDAASNTDGYWTMKWDKAPSLDLMPTRIELWVDGELIGNGPVQLNGPDNQNRIGGVVVNDAGTILKYVVGTDIPAVQAGESYVPFISSSTQMDKAIKAGATTLILGDGNYIIPDSAQGKVLNIVGNGNTVIATQDDGSYEGCDYSLDGATVTFSNVTINTDSHTYTGYARMKGTYNNCTINGTYTLYGDSVFNNCTFNVSGDVYNIWTWGAPTATFTGCTFNSDGKAMLLYGTENTKLTINDCVFNDNGGLTDLKAAVEIGNDYGKSYELVVNNTTVNGYEINDKGINTGTTLWANKNSMGTDKLNVVVDGVDVY